MAAVDELLSMEARLEEDDVGVFPLSFLVNAARMDVVPPAVLAVVPVVLEAVLDVLLPTLGAFSPLLLRLRVLWTVH